MRLSKKRLEEIDALFEEVLDLPETEQQEFLNNACVNDPEKKALVERLLNALTEPDTFFDQPLHQFTTRFWKDFEQTLATDLPSQIGPYVIEGILGRGGMAMVYMGRRDDGVFDQKVAIKIVRTAGQNEEIITRFAHERQILASLEHPNLARLIDGGTTEDGKPFFVMEYVDGTSIDHFAEQSDLSLHERLHLFIQVGKAVQHAHQNLVVHRDLKPGNILVTKNGTVKLLDFGIAKLLDQDSFREQPLTRTEGLRWMTPEYAAPEQIRKKAITTATDVYALGVILYRLVTGKQPYIIQDRSLAEVEHIVTETIPSKPSAVSGRRDLRGDLDTIILKAIAKEPERRYQTAASLVEDLERYLDGVPVRARPDTLLYRLGKFARRNPWPLSMAAMFLILVSSFAIVMALQQAKTVTERDKAQLEAAKANAVTDFLVEIFEANDPSRARGDTLNAYELLTLGASRIDQGFAQNDELRKEMYDVMGRVHLAMGDYSGASPFFEKHFELLDSTSKGEEMQFIKGLLNLGTAKQGISEYTFSDSLLERAQSYASEELGHEHPLLADILFRRANGLHESGQAGNAAGLFDRAYQIYEKHPDDVENGWRIMQILADYKFFGGNPAAAESLYTEAVRVGQQRVGLDNLDVLYSLSKVAGFHMQRQEYHIADSLYRLAASKAEAIGGDKHTRVAQIHQEATSFYTNWGNLDRATYHTQQAIKIYSNVYGPDHAVPQVNQLNLARLYNYQGLYEESLPLYEQTYAGLSNQFGPNSQMALPARQGIGEVLYNQGSIELAEPILQATLDSMSVYLSENTSLARTRMYLGALLCDTGRPDDGLVLIEEAVQKYNEALPVWHWNRADAYRIKGQCLLSISRIEEAKKHLEDALQVLDGRGDRFEQSTRASLALISR